MFIEKIISPTRHCPFCQRTRLFSFRTLFFHIGLSSLAIILPLFIYMIGLYINNFRYEDDITLMAENKEELKSFLMKVERGEWKSWLNIQKTMAMASSPITSWQINRNTIETDRLYFLGLQNHCGDCSHEIKRRLLLGRRAITNLDSILKCRDITLLAKVHTVKAMVF